MQVLVTGCAGRIGSQTACMLLERGDAVVGFDLRPSQITHASYSEAVGTFDDPAAAARAVAGILLALDHPFAAGGTFNLGATEPVDFADLVPAMAEATGLPVAVVDLPGAGVWYQTSNARIRETLGFTPEWPISRMLTEAVGTWTTRHR